MDFPTRFQKSRRESKRRSDSRLKSEKGEGETLSFLYIICGINVIVSNFKDIPKF